VTLGQYLLFSLLGLVITVTISYYFIIVPGMRRIQASQHEVTDTDTDYHSAQLYRVEGRQILVIPRECELAFRNIKLRRQSGILLIYPRTENGSELAERLLPKANSDHNVVDDKAGPD